MKIKVLFLLSILTLASYTVNAQRGVRIGYIDTEYILENVPEYQEASGQLDSKVQKWKSEIELKLASIEQKRNDLSNESVLLTAELIKEREEDIAFEEKEILDYQQRRFGPNGDLMIQKKQLIQPVQDEAKKKEVEANKAARAKSAEEKKAAALAAREAKKKEAAERRQAILDKRARDKAERDGGATTTKKKLPFDIKMDEEMENGTPFEEGEKEKEEIPAEVVKDKAPTKTKEQEEKVVPKTREERQKILDERKKKKLEERARLKAEREAKKKTQDSTKNNNE